MLTTVFRTKNEAVPPKDLFEKACRIYKDKCKRAGIPSDQPDRELSSILTGTRLAGPEGLIMLRHPQYGTLADVVNGDAIIFSHLLANVDQSLI
jgi:hypothetical protein